jgi:hypothetical protein
MCEQLSTATGNNTLNSYAENYIIMQKMLSKIDCLLLKHDIGVAIDTLFQEEINAIRTDLDSLLNSMITANDDNRIEILDILALLDQDISSNSHRSFVRKLYDTFTSDTSGISFQRIVKRLNMSYLETSFYNFTRLKPVSAKTKGIRIHILISRI